MATIIVHVHAVGEYLLTTYGMFRYRKREDTYHRFVGNVLIAIGATLPGIGGMATRAGYTEVLYVGEFLGIILIWMGYRWNVRVPIPAREPVGVRDLIQPSPT